MIFFPKKFYVYTHSINGDIFYVGSGSGGRIGDLDHNDIWHSIIAEAGGAYDAEIIAWFDTRREAYAREKLEILSRRPKANIAVFQHSQSTKTKIGLGNSGKVRNEEMRRRQNDATIELGVNRRG